MTSCIGGGYDGPLGGMHCDYLPPSQQQQQQQQPQAGRRGMPKKSEPVEITGPGSRSKKMNKLETAGGPVQQQQQSSGGPGGAGNDLMSSFGLKEDNSSPQIMKGGGPGNNGPKSSDSSSINSSSGGPGIDTMSKMGPDGGPDGHPGDGDKMNQGIPGMMSNKLEYTQQQSPIKDGRSCRSRSGFPNRRRKERSALVGLHIGSK